MDNFPFLDGTKKILMYTRARLDCRLLVTFVWEKRWKKTILSGAIGHVDERIMDDVNISNYPPVTGLFTLLQDSNLALVSPPAW